MKNRRNILIAVTAVLGLIAGHTFAAPSPNFRIFLCFGQSNMSGGNRVYPESVDTVTNPRIKTLSFGDCPSPRRTFNQWAPAREPMHCDDGANTMGPSYAFGRVLADTLKDDTIGLIPCGLYGVAIEMFMKGGTYRPQKVGENMPNTDKIPGVASADGGYNAYQWMLNKCKIAGERGVLSGILLHQGESNSGQSDWPAKVKGIYDSLKKDLGIKDIPFVAGEVLYGGVCSGHNEQVRKIPATIPEYGYYASAQGLSGVDSYHFDRQGYRELGRRFAVEILKGLKTKIDYRRPGRVISAALVNSARNNMHIYSLSGGLVSDGAARTSMKPGNIYVVVNKTTATAAKLMIAPGTR